MPNDNDEYDGLLDDDPALDCLLFEEMRKEEIHPKGPGGCLAILILFVIPVCSLLIHLAIA